MGNDVDDDDYDDEDGLQICTTEELIISPGGFHPIVGMNSEDEAVWLMQKEPWQSRVLL